MEITIKVTRTKNGATATLVNPELIGEALLSAWFELSDLCDLPSDVESQTLILAHVKGRAAGGDTLPMMRFLRGVIAPALLIAYRAAGYNIHTTKAAVDMAKQTLGFVDDDGQLLSFTNVNYSLLRRFISCVKEHLSVDHFIDIDAFDGWSDDFIEDTYNSVV